MFGFVKSIIVAFAFGFAFASSIRADDEATSYQDTVCGPRCVKFLFHWYLKTDIPLVDLVHEIQWPGVTNGTSFAAIKSSLAARGVVSSGAAVDDLRKVAFEYPTIAFLPNADAAKLGHYVILLPGSTSDSVRKWDGLSGIKTLTYDELSELQCKEILITAPNAAELERIVQGDTASANLLSNRVLTAALAGQCAIVICVVGLAWARKW